MENKVLIEKYRVNIFYVYIYLDPRKPGEHIYFDDKLKLEVKFDYEPFYVGKGQNKRSTDHLRSGNLKKNSYKNNKIKKIIQKTEEQPEIITFKENLFEKEALNLERQLVALIGRYDLKKGPLANLTDAGDGPQNRSKETREKISKANNIPVLQFDLTGKLIKEWRNIKAITHEFGLSKSSLQSIIHKNVRIYNNNIFFYKKEFKGKQIPKSLSFKLITDLTTNKENQRGKKKVVQFSINGVFINEFKSIRHASNFTGIGKAQISRVCNKIPNYKTAGGFIWKYNDGRNIFNPDEHSKKQYKKVIQYTLEGEKIKKFNSMTEASKKLKITKNSIWRACNNKHKTAGGFIWKYAD